MSTSRRRITIGLLGALALTTAFVRCSDTGPTVPRDAGFAIAPVFASDAAGAVDIAGIRFVLTRRSDGSVARDTVLQIAAGQDSVNLLMTVPVLTPGEQFLLTLAMVNAAGDTVFRGGPTEVTATTTGGAPPVVQIPVVYVGVGFNAASVQILTPDTSTFSGEAVTLTAAALDSLGGPIPGTPIVWRTLDSVQATVPDPDVGQVVGGAARGTARIVAELLTGPRDTANVGVQPLPSVIAAESGGGQTGSIAGTLPQPLVARVTAPDALGVEGLWIRFAVTSGGGSVAVDSALSDAMGRASTTWTLGASAGAQTVEVTTARLPTATATFGATAVGTLTITSGDAQTGTVGVSLAQALVVLVEDAATNPVPGVQIDWAVTQGNGMVGAASSVTDASGLASTTFTLGTLSGTAHEVTASIGGGASVAFGATALPGAPAALAFVAQPMSANVNATLSPVQVEVLDAFANRVTTDNSTDVDAAITSGTGTAGAVLSGTTTQTASAGLVTFADLSINLGGTAYTLDASIPSLALVTSAAFNIVAPTGNVMWINAAGGNWSDGTNWDAGTPPTALDTAIIALDGSYTVTVDVAATVSVLNVGGATGTQTLLVNPAALTIDDGATFGPTAALSVQGSGTLTGAGFVSIAGTFTWGGGTLSGTGTTRVESGGTLDLSGTTKTLNTRTVENAGAATHSSGTVNAGNGAIFVNDVGGTYDMVASVTFDWGFGTTSVFDNRGSFTSSAAGPFMDAQFDHTGAFDVTTGTLQLRGGGTLDAPVTTSGTVQLAGGTFNLLDNFTATGTGTVLLSSATVTVASPAVADFVNFTQSGGTVNGDGQVTITGLFTWTAGTQGGTGTTRLESTGTLDLSGGTKTLDSRTLENAGAATHASGSVNAGNGALFVNEIGATYDMTASVTFDWGFGATSVFDNQGTFTNAGATSFMDAQLLHTGTGFDVANGATLQLRGGGTLDAPMTTSGTIQLAGGAFDLLDALAVTGSGNVLLSTGTATVTSPDVVDLGNFTQSGGTVNGDGQMTITGLFAWTAGTQGGTGTTRLESTGTLTLSGSTKTLDTRTIENAGTATHSSGTVNAGNGATFVNEVGATYDMTASVTFDWGFGAMSVFNNQGTFTNAGGTSFIDAQLIHSGPGFDVATGTTLQIRNGGTLDAPMTTSGTIQLAGGTFDLLDAFAVSGTGDLLLSSGTATVTSPDIVDLVNFAQSGGTVNGDGQLNVTGTFTWTGGTQGGTGTTALGATATTDLSVGTKILDTRTMQNAGVATHSVGSVNAGNGGTWINEIGATYDMTAGVTFDWGFGATSVFDNQGTLVRSTAAGTSFIDATLLNTGTIDVQVGAIEARGGFDHAAGAVIRGSGTLGLASATITAFDGDVNPGTSPGILNITGSITQSALSTINLEVLGTGTTPGVDFDQLNVSGTATLNGTITLIVSAVPTLGDSLPVITFASRAGTLANLFAPPQQSGIIGDTVTTPTSFSVVARSQILFAGNDGVVGGVFRVSPNAQDLTNITTEGQGVTDDDYFARWAPSRDRLTYAANNAPPPFLLHVTSWDGAEIAHPIADTNTARPRFSENTGTGMLHLASICGDFSFTVQDVCVVPDVSGSIPGLEGIGDGPGKVWVTDAVDASLGGSGAFTWNPTNPDQLAVVRDSVIGPLNRDASQIWLVNYDGSGVAELTPNVIIDGADTLSIQDNFGDPGGFMDWSPDGSFIAFSAFNQNGVSSIYRVEVATGTVTRLSTPSGGDDDQQPVISPDGSTILFIRHGFLAEATRWDLFTIPAGGGTETQVTDESLSGTFFGIQSIGYDWSPDGNEIVLSGSDGLNPAVYVVPANTTAATYLANRLLVSRIGAVDIQPSWRP